MDNKKERNHKEQSLYYQNSFRGLLECIQASMVELIREFGKVNENDPNVYEIDLPKDEVICDNGESWIGGYISLDVAYYDGIILVQAYEDYMKLRFKAMYDFGSLDVKTQMLLYRKLALQYDK